MLITNYKQIEHLFKEGIELSDFIKVKDRDLPILINFDDFYETKSNFIEREGKSIINRNKEKNIIYSSLSKLTGYNTQKTQKNIDILIKKTVTKEKWPKILVIGGGKIGNGIKEIYDSKEIEVIAFDIYASENLTFIADAHYIPLKDESVDGVIIQAVLEHVLNPQKVVDEIYRVLKKEGIVYAETPFLQPVHEGAFDFTRFTESGHRFLFKKFELISSGSLAGPGMNLLWDIEYLTRGIFKSVMVGKLAKLAFFWVKYFDLIISEKYAIDAANGIYFLGCKADGLTPLSTKDILSIYKGAY